MPRSFNASYSFKFCVPLKLLPNVHIFFLRYPSGILSLVYLKWRRIEFLNLKTKTSLAFSWDFCCSLPINYLTTECFLSTSAPAAPDILPCSLIWTPPITTLHLIIAEGFPEPHLCFALTSHLLCGFSRLRCGKHAALVSQFSVTVETPCGWLIFTLSLLKIHEMETPS